MYLGYMSYYPLVGVVTLYYFFCRSSEFDRTVFVILGSFFLYYLVFVFLPVTGPQYYYLAVGMDNIANGVFPNVNDYFVTHMEALPMGGNSDGFLYQSFVDGHTAGERPTAAFPSRRLTLFILPFFILMTLATVYIRAHYLIDVFAGWVSAVLFYTICQTFWTKAKRTY